MGVSERLCGIASFKICILAPAFSAKIRKGNMVGRAQITRSKQVSQAKEMRTCLKVPIISLTVSVLVLFVFFFFSFFFGSSPLRLFDCG